MEDDRTALAGAVEPRSIAMTEAKGTPGTDDDGSSLSRGAATPSDRVVTLVVHGTPRDDAIAEYEAWLERICAAAQRSAAGFLQQTVLRPVAPNREYTVLVKFDSIEALRDWEASDVRGHLMEELQPLLDPDSTLSRTLDDVGNVNAVVDYDQLSKSAAASLGMPQRPPPRWKFVSIILMHVLWIVYVVSYGGLGSWIGVDLGLGHFWGTFVIITAAVAMIQYLCVPLTAKLLHKWLAAPRPQYFSEPMRSLDEGLPCFAPSMDVAALNKEIRELREKAERMQLSADRRVTRLEEAVSTGSLARSATGGGGDMLAAAQAHLTAAQVRKALGASNPGARGSHVGGTANDVEAGVARRGSIFEEPDESSTDPVTVILRHVVREGKEADYEAWVDGIATFAHDHSVGHLGTTTIRPPKNAKPEDANAYTIMFKYDNVAHLNTWLASDARMERLKALMPLIETTLNVDAFTGFKPLRSLYVPATASGGGPPAHPPMYRSWALTTVGLFCVVMFTNTYIAPELAADGVPPELIPAIGAMINVFIVGFIYVPLSAIVCRRWLTTPVRPTGRATRCLTKGCLH